ncbi:hypothetical protein CEXT_169971 [Caerostris extrusa]|uniref:Uncharacterized protein n=1 Tax=Caerostris extrusa TaxID=172846 RepID=A0AAV4PXF8_CAEEX|nr:hypothetical protein CEXT_169971 [Caerostris extrusa]
MFALLKIIFIVIAHLGIYPNYVFQVKNSDIVFALEMEPSKAYLISIYSFPVTLTSPSTVARNCLFAFPLRLDKLPSTLLWYFHDSAEIITWLAVPPCVWSYSCQAIKLLTCTDVYHGMHC